MKAQFLARGKKEHKNQKANDYNKLQSLQNGLVCDVSSAFDAVAAVAAPIPSLKLQIALINLPRSIFASGNRSFEIGVCVERGSHRVVVYIILFLEV